MSAAARRTGGLAARIVRVALNVGIVTVVLAVMVAFVSTSRLASDRAAARDLISLRLVEGAIDERLVAATAAIERASGLIAASRTETELAGSVTPLFSGSRALFSRIVVMNARNRRMIVAVPGNVSATEIRVLPAYREALQGASGFVSSCIGDEHQFWATRTTVTAWGDPVIILARLDEGFLRRALERSVRDQDGRLAVLLDSDGMVGWAGSQEPPDMENALWTAEDQGLGRVSVVMVDGERYSGYYNDIEGATGISWRVVAAEPVSGDLIATVSTVAPFIIVVLLGGTVGIVLAWYVSGRVVSPLRDLERTARNAAAGAYVKPLPADADDEVGRVALAFNQVALRLNALHDLSQLLASASRLDQVLDGILSAMGHIVGPGASVIYLLDPDRERLTPARTRGIGMASVREVELTSGGWLVEALDSSGPLTLTGSPEDLAVELPGLAGSAIAALAAPLVVGHETLGVVVILRDDVSSISEAEREMVRTFSAQAAVAVQTSRLFEIESESRHVAEALRAVAEELVRPESLDRSLGMVEWIVADLFGARSVRIVIIDRSVLGLESAPEQEFDTEFLGIALRLMDPGGHSRIVGRGEDEGADALLDAHDADELMIVPIAVETDHGAVMVALLPANTTSSSVQVAGAIADEIALALDNAYFFGRAIARAENLETIFRISQAVGSSLQVNVVLNRVLDVVQKILSADAVMMWSFDARRRALDTAMVRGDVPATMARLELSPGEDLPGHVFQSGQPVLMRDLTEGMGGVAGSAASQRLRSLIAVPLLARGRALGVLMVFSAQAGAFNEEDMNVLQTFASQAALAIDTARLYSKEHEVAQVLQQSILPEALSEFPEVESGSQYAPAGGEAEIGGDYYDLFRAPDGRVWFSIGDVCGKGVHAATKTSMIKYALRALVAAGLSPGGVAAEVNRMVADSGDPSDIVTLWVGCYDRTRAILTWSNGGHPPGILRRRDGSVERLSTTGPLMGAAHDAEYGEQTTDFGPEDRILLYTDGVTEARQGNTFFGEERVVNSLAIGRSAQEDARLLLESVREFVRADLRDDVAILVIVAREPAETNDQAEAVG